ncbi:carbamoyltransferase HypF [Thalassobacillus hwangdonensis]|uniref:Carbamoyltransferase n=1 Tax=Thalassobacillus hwangdonensis TaxID=546108 RepID=A0ABW3KYR9_9BACI
MADRKLGGTHSNKRVRLDVTGVVQGVGFRPYVFRLAKTHKLNGFVSNCSGNVTIEIEGDPYNIKGFTMDLPSKLKPPGSIDRINETYIEQIGDTDFVIKESVSNGKLKTVFPADLAVCEECLTDIKGSTRFNSYPLTSCTFCGPRYSIIRALPYDREKTSMAAYQLCEACNEEYKNPMDRRFHAQPIACPVCGPNVIAVDGKGNKLQKQWLKWSNEIIAHHGTIAVKGIGGFHLICDATKSEAITLLRKRKKRSRKPFALMARDINAVERYFEINETERHHLKSTIAPIVLLRPNAYAINHLPLHSIAPGLQRVGVMLPYTALHHLLFADGPDLLIATSGNLSGLPISRTNEEALDQLKGLSDGFLLHDREIVTQTDDSVTYVSDGKLRIIRRSRGYVPSTIPIPLPKDLNIDKVPVILGAGGDMKNTFCVVTGKDAVLSQHIGDIENLETLEAFHSSLQHLSGLLNAKIDVIGFDPHPEYMISKQLKARKDVNFQPIYHHHAHMAACMAEHQLTSPVIACILDGTGYGKDGNLWGFEILTGDYIAFKRHIHLQPIALPGGEASIKNPWMIAISLIHRFTKDIGATGKIVSKLFPQYEHQIPLVLSQLRGSSTMVTASSAGRLFDGISAILQLCTESAYDGEAAMIMSEKLEETDFDPTAHPSYTFDIEDGVIKYESMIEGVLDDIDHLQSSYTIIKKFHQTLAEMILKGVIETYKQTNLNTVVFSGGVWNNRHLLSCSKALLEKEGFSVFSHEKVPTGDGGISLGQAVSSLWRWSKENVSIHASKGD